MARQRKRKALYKLYGRLNEPKTVWRIETGHAGFIRLYKDGKRIQPKNFLMEFRR